MSNSGLTVGIVGLGAHGTNYAEILTSLGHEVYGVDAEPNARREFQATFNTETFEDPMELFEADVDAAIICTPTKFHEATTTSALENDLDVLVETPLGHDLSSAEHIASVAEKTGNVCMVAFYERFRNICQVTKSYLNKGYFGDVTHIHAKFIRRRGVPGRGTWYTSQDIAGGGALMDVGGHLLDLLLYFLDWPLLTDTMATSRSDFGQQENYAYLRMWGEDGDAKMYDVEDSVTAFCEFDNGTTASVEVAWAANVQSEHSYTIRGTEAGAHLDITDTIPEVEEVPGTRNNLDIFEARSGVADHFVNSEVVTSKNDPYNSMMKTFVDAVLGDGRPTANNIHQGLAVQQTIDELYGASSD